MSRLKSLIRLHQWKLDEKLRDLRELERLHSQLQARSTKLNLELAEEQAIAEKSREASYTYANYVESVFEQQRNLKQSIYETISQIQDLEEAVAKAYRELKKYELTEANRQQRQKQILERHQQNDLDEVALNLHRRRPAGLA